MRERTTSKKRGAEEIGGRGGLAVEKILEKNSKEGKVSRFNEKANFLESSGKLAILRR